jgi:hypothetical protein
MIALRRRGFKAPAKSLMRFAEQMQSLNQALKSWILEQIAPASRSG